MLLSSVATILLSTQAFGQVETVASAITSAEQAPSSVHWRRIVTSHFEVVFPSDFAGDAQRVAAILERLRTPMGTTIGTPPGRLTVVLQTQSTIANGYVALGPRRAVWYTTPPEFEGLLGTGDWLTLLATHEMRHVAQTDRATAGFTRGLGYVFGDLGRILGAHFSIPDWMWEGDAVGTETALGSAGRGRMPEFDKEIRALALADRLPTYRQAVHGSLARYFPNEYPLGYTLTTYLRRTQGPDIIGRLFGRSGARAYDPLAFEHALKHETGMSAPALFDSTMVDLRRRWTAQLDGVSLSEARPLTSPRIVWTSYQYPQYLGDRSVVAVKHGLDDATTLVRLDSARVEQRLTAINPNGPIRASGTRVVWAETVPDPRWGLRDYSVIRTYDYPTGVTHTVTHRTRLFSPVLSPDGRRIAAIEQSTTARSTIVVVAADDGTEMVRLAAPAGQLLRDPSWTDDGRMLVLTRQDVHGKAVALADPATGRIRDLTPTSRENVSRPMMQSGRLFFASPYSGIDNLYTIDTTTGRRSQVTSRRIGAYEPALSSDGRSIVFADYTADGYMVAEASLDSTQWIPIERVEQRMLDYAAPLAAQEGRGALDSLALDSASRTKLEVRSYPMTRRLFSVHSWLPEYDDLTSQVGLTLQSTNVLNTLGSELGYTYDRTEHAGAVRASVSYAGLYPIIDLGLRSGTRASSYADTDSTRAAYRWRETSLVGALRLPLDYSRGTYRRGIDVAVRGELTRIAGLERTSAFDNNNGLFAPLTYAVEVVNLQQRAPRDLQSPWGQQARVEYSHTPFGGDYEGSRLGASLTADVPGLVRHHGLRLTGAIERRAPGPYHFASELPFTRGFDYVYRDRTTRVSAEYKMPLAYPDLALGPIAYIKRVQATGFYDHAVGRGGGPTLTYRSAGVELTANTTLFSWDALPFAPGLRYVYRAGLGHRLEPMVTMEF